MLDPATQIPLPASGRLAGIDYGTARIGVAISDISQHWASPLETWQCSGTTMSSSDEAHFKKLATAEELVGWVVGLPLHISGQPSEKSVEAIAFGNWLSEKTGLGVNWIDERFTTAAAREILNASSLSGKKRKAKLDQIAAQVILKTYLESDRSRIVAPIDQTLDDG